MLGAVLIRPAGSVKQFALEIMQAFDFLRELPIIQKSIGPEQDVARIVDRFAGQSISDFDVPLAFFLVPFASLDDGVEAHEFA